MDYQVNGWMDRWNTHHVLGQYHVMNKYHLLAPHLSEEGIILIILQTMREAQEKGTILPKATQQG